MASLYPVPPSNLRVFATGANSIGFTWTNNDNYDYLELWYKAEGGAWANTFEDIEGRSDWDYTQSSNTRYHYKIRGHSPIKPNPSDFSNEVNICLFSDDVNTWISEGSAESGSTDHPVGPPAPINYTDTVNVTIGIGHHIAEGGTIRDSWSTDISVTTKEIGSSTFALGYYYYLGTSSGMVCTYAEDYKGDNGASIDAYWKSKVIASQDISEQLTDNWMSLYKIQVWYVDLSANTQIIVSVTPDGNTWVSQAQTVGNGDGSTNFADFFFVTTSPTGSFQYKIEQPSNDKKFQFIRSLCFISPGGEIFQI